MTQVTLQSLETALVELEKYATQHMPGTQSYLQPALLSIAIGRNAKRSDETIFTAITEGAPRLLVGCVEIADGKSDQDGPVYQHLCTVRDWAGSLSLSPRGARLADGLASLLQGNEFARERTVESAGIPVANTKLPVHRTHPSNFTPGTFTSYSGEALDRKDEGGPPKPR